MTLEQIIQIISILGFFAGGIIFLVNTGSYKKGIEKDIDVLKAEVDENKKEIKLLHEEVEKLRDESTRNTNRFEALLIEVKTKLELFMQMSGVFNKENNNE